MANVIRLQDHASRTKPKTNELPADQKAAILMFTGIRYERMDGDQPDKPTSTSLPGAHQKH